jgi:hypothetical protein
MNKDDIILLEDNGWEVECESPFEISHEHCDASATGFAAEIVLDYLKTDRDNGFSEQDMHDCFSAGVNRGVTIAAIITRRELYMEFPSYQEYMKRYDEDKD